MQAIVNFQPSAIQSFVRDNSVFSLVTGAKEAVNEGKDPLEIMQAFKLFKDAFDELNEDYDFKSYVMKEAQRHISVNNNEKNPVVFNGFKMYYGKHTTTVYNDDVTLMSLKLKVKEREKFLKTLQQTIFDESTGEVLAEPARYLSKETLVLTKPK